MAKSRFAERVAELVEARQMAGSGPWQVSQAVLDRTDQVIESAMERYGQQVSLRESIPFGASGTAQNVWGDLTLRLQNLEWRREIQSSMLEFSRWGIQEIILISRLHYIKHPWIRRGINLSAAYVFGQGVELSSPDPDANEVLTRFIERNKVSLGQNALTEQERRKGYDGNLFWCLFADTQDRGETNVRLIDATEIQEIVSDPEDMNVPQYYKRVWTSRIFDVTTGEWGQRTGQLYYPALGYDPTVKPQSIGGIEVRWDSPIYHRKCGYVATWAFGCPRVYPGIDWAKEGTRHLTACASVTQALSQVAIKITTKGGQQALEGLKEQFGTTVGPLTNLYDQNPPAVQGSIFASGPGTQYDAFKSRGAGADPSEVKEFRNMVACVLEIPPTWLGDMETSNLSTAQTLDRPTELGFLLKQEEWQEDLTVMGMYALEVSKGAPSGRLREAITKRNTPVTIREARRKIINGHWVYEAAKKADPETIEVLCNFPAIVQGDIPALSGALVSAAQLIDPKSAARKTYDYFGFENADELTEAAFPEATYDPDKTKEPAEDPDKVRIRKATARVEEALHDVTMHRPGLPTVHAQIRTPRVHPTRERRAEPVNTGV